jgi:hypothetical protein
LDHFSISQLAPTAPATFIARAADQSWARQPWWEPFTPARLSRFFFWPDLPLSRASNCYSATTSGAFNSSEALDYGRVLIHSQTCRKNLEPKAASARDAKGIFGGIKALGPRQIGLTKGFERLDLRIQTRFLA